MTEPLLKARDLHLSFGGVKAADGVDLDIHREEFLAIIGSNGSGKTTFLNMCTGYLRPDHGEVHFDGRPITRLTPRAITRLGIARAFQLPQLFTSQNLISNVLLAVAARRGFWGGLKPLDRKEYREEAEVILELVGLSDVKDQNSAELAEGVRKLADIAIALALKPRLLLLDEPTSGVSATEKFKLMETLIEALRLEGVTALFVEHDMEIVRRYAGRAVVWEFGRVIAQGEPEQVLNDPHVLKNVVGMA